MIARALVLALFAAVLGGAVEAQREQADTTKADSLRPVILEPVVVSVTRHPAALSQVPFAVAVVDRDEIVEGRPTIALDEALNTVPGLLVANRYNPSQDDRISIRGFGARAAFGVRGVKILLDGIPQTLPDGQGQLNNIDLADVSRVEILRGPSSALYGNASGGVISLSTERDRPSRLSAETRVLAGSYELFKWQGNVSAPVGRGDLSLSASQTAWRGYREHSEAETRRVALRFSQPFSERSGIVFHGMLAHSPWLEDPGALTLAEMEEEPTRASPRNLTAGPEGAGGAGKSVTQAQAGLAFKRSFRSGGGLEVAGFGVLRDLENQLAFAYIELDRLAYGGRASLSLPKPVGSLPQVLTAGIDVQLQRDDRINRSPDRSELTRDQLERVLEVGPFVQSQLTVERRFTLTAGARYDLVRFTAEDRFLSDGNDSGERVMASWSGSAGLLVDLGEPAQPYLNLSTSFETPTTTELANRPTGPGGFNPDLEPQRAVNYELGLRGRLSDRFQYSLAAFRADVTGELIPFEVPGEPGRRFFRNAGSSRHRGLEAGVTARLPFGLTLLAAYTFSDYRFVDFKTERGVFDGNRIPGVPLHQLHWSVRYYGPAGYWLALDNTHVSSYYVDDANTEASQVSPWTNSVLRSGWRTSVGLWEVKPFLGVSNLLDHRYVGSAVVNAQFGRYYEPAPGRTLYLGLELRSLAP
ncbi:Ferrichrome-iron receptor [bacterium HR33]|nr:Ferrichrome-iron receptor [bacterium HR33]